MLAFFKAGLSGVFDATKDGYSRLTQNVLHDGFPEPRSVVVKHETVCLLVVAEFVQTVGIREFAERAKLRRIEPVLEFVGDGHECHARDYSIRAFELWRKHDAIARERCGADAAHL